MKKLRFIQTALLTIFSACSLHLNPQGPGPLDMWDTLPPEQQLAPYIEAAKFAKGVFKGVGNEATDILNNPEQAAAMGVIGLGTSAFIQVATPEVAATATRVLCTLATAETVAQLHHAYINTPENQRSEAIGEKLGRMIADVFFLHEAAKASSSTLTNFKPSKPLSYVVKVDDYAFAAKFNPDGQHFFSIGRNFGSEGFSFSVYGLDPINGLRYYGPQSIKSFGNQVPTFPNQANDILSFYPTTGPGSPKTGPSNIKITENSAFFTDAERFFQTARNQQVHRITSFLDRLKVTDYQDHDIVHEKVAIKIDPAMYTPLENLLKTVLENNIEALKESGTSIYDLLKYSGDPISTSNIKGANGEIYVGVLQQLMGRKLVDYNKKVKTANIIPGREAVTFDWATKTSSGESILIEVKNQKYGGGDEAKFIQQIGDQLRTINAFDDLKNSKLEVWSEHPLTDVMKDFLNKNNVKYFENYSSLAKLYFPEMKQPIFFDNPTPTHIQQFSLLNNFLSQAPSLKFTPPTSWFTEHGYQANEPPVRSTSSPFGSWSTGFAGMPLFQAIPDWTSGIKWDSYFDTIKTDTQGKSEPTDDPFHFKENGYYGAQFFRNSYPRFGGTNENQIPFATDSNFDFFNQDGLKGGKYEGPDYTVGLGFGSGTAGIYGSYYISPVLASALLQIGVAVAGLYLVYWALSPEYEYSWSILNNFKAKTPDQQKLAEAVLYTPNFPWKTFLEQEWDPQNLSLNNKPAKKQLKTHGNLYQRFKIAVLKHVEPDNHVMTELYKVSTEGQEEYKNQHQKDELSDLYKLLYTTVALELQHALNRLMFHENQIKRYNLILEHEEDAEAANHQTRIVFQEYQAVYLETAKAMVALQKYSILNELILNKTIALQRMLDFQHDFLKDYSQHLDSITKTDHSTYLMDRKNALADTLAKPEEMTGTWRKSTVGSKIKDGWFVAYVSPQIITFGLPIQHVLDDELFILKAQSEKAFYALTEAAQGPVSILFEGMIELILDAHYMNSRGEIQQLISRIDNLRYLFDMIIEPKLIGKNPPMENKEKHNLCATNLAFNLIQELPAIIQQADASFDTFKNALKTALKEKISKTTDNALIHDHFYKGIIKFIDASSTNDGLKKLLETIQQSLLMAKKIEALEGSGTGLGLLNFLIKNPDKFDEWVKILNETQDDLNKKKQQKESKESAIIRQLLETKQCKACNLTTAHLNNQNLNDTTVDDADFTSAELVGISAEKMHANNTKFNKARLDNAVFKNTDCTNASFEDAYFKNAYFNECTLNNSQWHEAHLDGTIFNDTTSSGLDFNSAHFSKSFFGITPMILHSKLTSSKASHTEFKNIIIQESSLNGLAADHAKFDKAVIVGTDFDNANLTDAAFDHCTLKNVSFKGAKLAGSSWKDTTFENVDFTGADVHGVSFTQEQLKGARGI